MPDSAIQQPQALTTTTTIPPLSADPAALPESAGMRHPDELLPLVYEKLRMLARQRLSAERSDHTLQATALVHEAYVRLAEDNVLFASALHFYHAAAQSMRRILVDHARARGRDKRGGPEPLRRLANLSTVLDLASTDNSEEILAFDESICRLEVQMPEAAQVVRLRFFAGLSIAETASAMEISPRTVDREWQFARAWLYRDLCL